MTITVSFYERWRHNMGNNNLVPRISLLCLPWSLEEWPWLRLVTLPPRIWVAKKYVGWEGSHSIPFSRCDKLCAFQILQQSLKNYSLYRGSKSNLPMKNATHDFCRLQNIEDFIHKEIRQPNGGETVWRWARGSKCTRHEKVTYRIEVRPVDQSLESLNSEVIYFLLCVAFECQMYFCHTVD